MFYFFNTFIALFLCEHLLFLYFCRKLRVPSPKYAFKYRAEKREGTIIKTLRKRNDKT